MTPRQQLVSRVAAALRNRPRPATWADWLKAVEERLSECEEGEAYDALPSGGKYSARKFSMFVRDVQKAFADT